MIDKTNITALNHNNNFTVLRLFASVMVLYSHSFNLYKLPPPLFMNWASLGSVAVYIFFAISGYLISISWSRDASFIDFIGKRFLRIFPGLAVCIILTILVGSVITTLDVATYFMHPNTIAYAKNIFLYINYSLPGVFESNAYPSAVNGSLWSLPVEFSMYLIFALISSFLVKKWMNPIASIILLVSFFVAYYYIGISEVVAYSFSIKYIAICGMYFFAGVLIQQLNLTKFVSVSSVTFISVIWLCLTRWANLFEYFSYIALPFLVIGFGNMSSTLFSKFNKFDYSYGIYIYAFPIQQLISFYYFDKGHLFGVVASTLLTCCFAAISWYQIEKPALNYKKYLNFKRKAI